MHIIYCIAREEQKYICFMQISYSNVRGILYYCIMRPLICFLALQFVKKE